MNRIAIIILVVAIIFCSLSVCCFALVLFLPSGKAISTPYHRPTQTAHILLTDIPTTELQETPTLRIFPSVTFEPTEIITPTVTATLEPKKLLETQIIGVLGAGNRNIPRLTSIQYNIYDKGDIVITWAVNDNLFGEDWVIRSSKTDTLKILKVLRDSGIPFTNVRLIGTFPYSDKFGNSSETEAITMEFSKDTVHKINYQDYDQNNIWNIANFAYGPFTK